MEGRARSESPDHRRCSRAIDASSPRPLITRSSPTGARSLCCVRPLFIRAALIVSHRQQRSHLVYGREAQGRVACLVILRSCPSYLPLTRARPFETSTIGKQLLCVWSPKARRAARRGRCHATPTGRSARSVGVASVFRECTQHRHDRPRRPGKLHDPSPNSLYRLYTCFQKERSENERTDNNSARARGLYIEARND